MSVLPKLCNALGGASDGIKKLSEYTAAELKAMLRNTELSDATYKQVEAELKRRGGAKDAFTGVTTSKTPCPYCKGDIRFDLDAMKGKASPRCPYCNGILAKSDVDSLIRKAKDGAMDAEPEWRIILLLPNGTKDVRVVEAKDREEAIEKAKGLANAPNAKLSSFERMP